MNLNELLDICIKMFGLSDYPVAVTNGTLAIEWANDEAIRRFPSYHYPNALLESLGPSLTDKVFDHLRKGKTFSPGGLIYPLEDTGGIIFPVVEEGLVGCVVFPERHKTATTIADIYEGGLQEKIVNSFTDSYKIPLTIIFSTLGLMVRNTDENDVAMRTYIKLISQNCYRLYRLSNNLGDAARLSSGIGGIRLKNGDIAAFLIGLCEAAGVMTAAIGIPLKIDVPGDPIATAFDAGRLSKVILNLISNACKFTREGNQIRVRLEATNENVVVTIMDSGAGIGDDAIEHIFEPHYTANNEGLPFNGNGLGLYIARSIIAAHGGTIAVRSKRGEGTKFAFTIPIRPDENAPDYTAESGVDYLADRFSAIYVELSDICGAPEP